MRLLAYADLRYTTGPATGVYHHIAEVLSRLSSTVGWDLRLAIARGQGEAGGIPADNALAGFPALPLPLTNKQGRLLWGLSDRPALDELVHRFAPAWVYSPQELLVPARHARSAVTLHGMTYFEPAVGAAVYASPTWRLGRARLGAFLHRARETCDVVFCVSDYLRRQAIECFDFDPRRLVVIGNGVHSRFFAAADHDLPRAPVPEAEGRPFFLSVGGLNAFDGGAATLAVARVLARRLPEHRLLIAGRLHEPALAAEAAALPNVRLLGFVESARLPGMMRASSGLLCLPAVESFGIVPLEAMAAGCPVVAGDATALPETVGEGGQLVPFGAPEPAVEALARLVEDPAARGRWVAAGRRRAGDFTWDRVAARVRSTLAAAPAKEDACI